MLLQPELLDVFASAIVQASQSEEHGETGSVDLDAVLAGKIPIPIADRPSDAELSRLLTIATVQELLEHQIALREVSNEGVLLVLPTQSVREWSLDDKRNGRALVLDFEGAIFNVYATLVVRLAHSGQFNTRRQDIWKNAAIFRALAGGQCGLHVREVEAGRAELTIFYRLDELGRRPSSETQHAFEAFVGKHIERRAAPQSLKRTRIFECPACGSAIPVDWARALRGRGETSFPCPVDRVPISIVEPIDAVHAAHSQIAALEAGADRGRDDGVAQLVEWGKEQVGQYDVLLCYNSDDVEQVIRIQRMLVGKRIRPWRDDRIRPGNAWHEAVERVVGHVKTAIVFCGPGGTGRHQSAEINLLLSLQAKKALSIIPVLLPGAPDEPDRLFLGPNSRVDFRGEDEEASLERLVFGITGVYPG